MHTERIPVADEVQLAVDIFQPINAARAAETPADAGLPGVTTENPSFVLVHGLASNARLWDGVAARLTERGHRVATVDLRGHGRSSKPDGPYDVPTVADDLAAALAVLARQGFDRPVVAGQSWGGNVVLELAARHPELVRGIVCVDGGWLEPSREFPDWDACRAALAPPRLAGRPFDEIDGYIRSAHRDWPESGIRGTLANFEVRPDGTVAPRLTFDHHIAVLRGLWEHHPSVRYPDLAVPVLLVPVDGGDTDSTRRKRRDVERAAAAIAGARVHWFAGDHDIHAQRPDELAGVMHAMTTDGLPG